MLKLHMFQPQFKETFFNGKEEIEQLWLPYSTATLWAHAQDHQDIRESIRLEKLHYRREPIEQVISSMKDPDIAAFSCYVWNEQYNLALAERIKQEWPNCKIIFGGPQTGGNHLKYDFIDSRVNDEGEVIFLDMLRNIRDGRKINSLTKADRLKDLTWSSPYLIGLFDDIIKDAPSNYVFQTVLETTRGCPYQCTFCDWGALGSKIRKFEMERLEAEIKWIADNPVSVIFLGDANFGVFKERDMEIARMLQRHAGNGTLEYVAINFLKNSNQRIFEITKELKSMAKSVTLSLQSLNGNTLKAIKRENMKSNDLGEMLRLSRLYGTPTTTDMILGLPEETIDTWKKGLMELLEMGNDGFIDTHFTYILVNSELARQQVFEYKIKTVSVDDYDSESGITERQEMVVSTSTMTKQDMLEGFLWNWIVRYFHTSGYTSIVSEYANKVYGIPFIDFYQKVYDRLELGSNGLCQEYQRIKRATSTLLDTGKFTEGIKGFYDFYICSYPEIYKNVDSIFDMIKDILIDLDIFDSSIFNIQRQATMNDKCPPMKNVRSNFDLMSWRKEETVYDIEPRNKDFKGTYQDFWFHRRNSGWKNKITKI